MKGMSKLATPEQYRRELQDNLDALSKMCAGSWGQAPALEPTVSPALYVSCDFDLGDFPHKGQKILVHEGNLGRRPPEKVAREIMREVLSHRNTCDRCGIDTPPIYQRTTEAERRAGIGNQTGTRYRDTKEPGPIQPPDPPEELLFPKKSKRLKHALELLATTRA